MDVLAPSDILYEDNHVIAVAKPAGMPSTHFDGTTETVDRLVKQYLKQKYGKPGNVFLGIVHRLDKPTSGVLLFARTSKAAARLSEQFREGTVVKVYWAIIEGSLTPHSGTISSFLRKNIETGKVETVAGESDGGKQAVTDYQLLQTTRDLSLVELKPKTGRTHQLRVHLAHRAHPIAGDGLYGSPVRFTAGIALHAKTLTFQHPTQEITITLDAPLPRSWDHLMRLFQSASSAKFVDNSIHD